MSACSTASVRPLPAPAASAPQVVAMEAPTSPEVDFRKPADAGSASTFSGFVGQPAQSAPAAQVSTRVPPAAPAASFVPPVETESLFVPVAAGYTSTHLEGARERVFYYGPSNEGGVHLEPSREFVKIRDATYNPADEAVVSAPAPSVAASGAVETPSGDKPGVSEGRSSSLILMRRVLSGSAAMREGWFKPLGIHDGSIEGRRKAEVVMASSGSYAYAQGDLVWDDTNGWGWFTPSDTEH